MSATPPDPIESLGGYYQSLLLWRLFELGVFELIATPSTAESIAHRVNLSVNELRHCLEFLRQTTGWIDRDRRGRFRVAVSSAELRTLRFQVTKFAGAYGPLAQRLDRVLAEPGSAGRLVNRRALADAYILMKDQSRGVVAGMLLGAGVATLLDLGCGAGSLLVQLAAALSTFRGVGVDADRAMCQAARGHMRARGVSKRIRILQADAREVARLPDAGALHAASLLNELFGQGPEEAVRFLRSMKARYPGRHCWFVDYYGQLGYNPRVNRNASVNQALLHDLIQALSGQGVPPPDLNAWRKIYRSAEVRLVEAHEFGDSGMRWFVHRISL
jgi:SAM-dependent methyltransferase